MFALIHDKLTISNFLFMKTNYSSALIIAVVCTFLAFSATALGQETAQSKVEYEVVESYKDFRFSLGGGYALRLGKIYDSGDAKLNEMSKKLRHGYTVDADAQYFFKESWGLGINANWVASNTSGSDVTLPGVDRTINNYEETQNMLFVGPSYASRNETDKFLLVTTLSVGPLFYLDRMTLDGVAVDAKKTTLGVNAGIAGEYKLNATTGLGLKLSYTLGSINSVNIEGQNVDMDEKINVSNLMITAFISFRSW